MLKYLWSFITDFLTLIILIVLYPFRSSKLDVSKPGLDILCVHGYLHNGTGWGYFRKKLQTAGFGSVNTLSYPTLTQDIPTNSLKIKERIEQIKKETGRDVQILIGHSQGGLESLEYALEYASKNKPIYVITMGSPLHGTKVAQIAFGPSARQMEVNSSYLKSLHERLEKASHIHLLSLYSDADLIIQPTNSASIPELSYAQNEKLNALGHLVFLFSSRTINRIVAFLHSFDSLKP